VARISVPFASVIGTTFATSRVTKRPVTTRPSPSAIAGQGRTAVTSAKAVDLEFWDSQIDPGALHKPKALDPGPWPDELGFDQREIVADDQERHPGPFALHRLCKGIVKLMGRGFRRQPN
jgi:hypothetical protein